MVLLFPWLTGAERNQHSPQKKYPEDLMLFETGLFYIEEFISNQSQSKSEIGYLYEEESQRAIRGIRDAVEDHKCSEHCQDC